jgi:hypothetical protein
MAGIGSITLDSAGAVTAPSALPLTLPSADSVTVNPYALASFAPMPAERGVMWANGVDPVRHYVTAVLGTGLLAPSATPTATPTGTQADTTLDVNNGGAYTIADGDIIELVYPVSTYPDKRGFVYFRTSSPPSATPGAPANGVAIGASDGATLENLKKFINQTGVEGVDYVTGTDLSDFITATTVVTTGGSEKITIVANDYGTAGNGYASRVVNAPFMRFEDDPGGAGGAQTFFSGGTAGTGSTPAGGSYVYAYAFVREDDGAVSGLSTSVTADNGAGGRVDIAGMTASADTTVDYNRVYRTTVGGGLFYRVDEVAAATTTYQDSTADSTITNFGAVAFDERLHRNYRAGVAPRVRYLCRFQGRWFGAGALLAATYSSGTVAVDSTTAVATFTGAYPRTSWVGRTFQVNSVSETYTIMSVSESAGTATLDRTYEGTTNATANYTVKDLRDPYEVFWSEPGLPNNWPVTNSLKGVTSPDAKGVTGIYAAYESVIVFTRQSVWRLVGSDGIYQAHLVTDKCGCVSGHTVLMDAGRMFWLGQGGVYGWDGNGEPVNLTTPPQQDQVVRGQDDTVGRLSLAHAHRAVAVLDQDRSEARFYVPLDGERTNRYALVLDLQNGGFALDTCEDVTCAAVFQGPDGEDHAVTGDITGAIKEVGLSTSDCGYGFEPTNTVSSSTVRTVTVATTPFPTSSNGLWGAPVWHVSSDGTFTRNCVATNTSSALTYRRFMTAPSASTQFVVGGILMWVQTGRFDWGERHVKKVVPGATVSHSPQSDGQYFFFSAYGQGGFAVPSVGWTAGDLTMGNTADDFGPRRRFRIRKEAVLHGWGLCCIEPGCDPEFSGVTIEVRSPVELDL